MLHLHVLPQSDTGRETVDGLLGRSESVGLLLHCKYPAVNCDFCVMHLAWLLRAALTVMTVGSMHSHADGHWMPDQTTCLVRKFSGGRAEPHPRVGHSIWSFAARKMWCGKPNPHDMRPARVHTKLMECGWRWNPCQESPPPECMKGWHWEHRWCNLCL